MADSTHGSGDFVYELIPDWAKLPDGWVFTQVAAVAVDKDDNVYAFNRSEHPIIVFDRDGNFIKSFGEGDFPNAHGMCFANDGTLWLADNGDHTVKRYTTAGECLMVLGSRDEPDETGGPFNKPTDVTVSSNGDVYISDGYGNTRVHVFSDSGEYKFSWGQTNGLPGVWDGDFNLPHNIWIHKDVVYVADRENHRVQVFNLDGSHRATWTDFIQPTDIYIDGNDIAYVGELRNRVSIVDLDGNVLSRWGRFPSQDPGQFYAAHGIWADSRGDVYVGEVLKGQRLQKFRLVK
ncbi:MAG: peptidyl-alpha-hydroxyglycine alpha-amidating lyase family protein [Dehalococcoidia bacterium]|nr:peptidyl-alpha-hydroxyglycine alpha-amidating lyase family protein [Dehalococcoidia bacterium]